MGSVHGWLESAAISGAVSQFAASLARAQLVDYLDGEVIWAAEGDGSLDEPSGRLKAEEIVLVVKSPWSDHRGGYIVCSLSEAPDKKLFKLSGLCAPALPQALLDVFPLVHGTPEHLSCDDTHRLHVVVSTLSGLHRAQEFYDDVLQPLLALLGLAEGSDSDRGYEVIVTQSPHSIQDFAHGLACSATPLSRTIVLLSGDGGVVDLLNGYDEAASPDQPQQQQQDDKRPAIALLPLGTGNALFHSLHKPHYAAAADGKPVPSPFVLGLRTLVRGHAVPLSSFEASFSPRSRIVSYAGPPDAGEEGAEGAKKKEEVAAAASEPRWPPVSRLLGAIVASYGFHASLVWESDTPAYRVHGDKRFGMAAQELLKVSHPYDCAVEVLPTGNSGSGSGEGKEEGDGNGWVRVGHVDAQGATQQRFNYVLATLVSNLEKTFTISPASRPLDGQLRLVWFGGVDGPRTMEIMMAAYQEGKHVDLRWESERGEEKVGYEAIDRIRVTVAEEDPRWRKVCIDGTIVELEQGGWMEVKTVPADQARLRVLVGQL